MAKTKKKTITCVHGVTLAWVITTDLLRIQMQLDEYMEKDKIRICIYGVTSAWVFTAGLLRIKMQLDEHMEKDKIN